MARKITYTLVHSNGSLETLSIPQFMGDCHEVAKRVPHTLVFMHLPKKHSVYAFNGPIGEEQLIQGPAIIFADADGTRIRTELPTDEKHAYLIYRTYVHPVLNRASKAA